MYTYILLSIYINMCVCACMYIYIYAYVCVYVCVLCKSPFPFQDGLTMVNPHVWLLNCHWCIQGRDSFKFVSKSTSALLLMQELQSYTDGGGGAWWIWGSWLNQPKARRLHHRDESRWTGRQQSHYFSVASSSNAIEILKMNASVLLEHEMIYLCLRLEVESGRI